MGFGIGNIMNSVANISSRKTDNNKPSESTLYEFYNEISKRGV